MIQETFTGLMLNLILTDYMVVFITSIHTLTHPKSSRSAASQSLTWDCVREMSRKVVAGGRASLGPAASWGWVSVREALPLPG